MPTHPRCQGSGGDWSPGLSAAPPLPLGTGPGQPPQQPQGPHSVSLSGRTSSHHVTAQGQLPKELRNLLLLGARYGLTGLAPIFLSPIRPGVRWEWAGFSLPQPPSPGGPTLQNRYPPGSSLLSHCRGQLRPVLPTSMISRTPYQSPDLQQHPPPTHHTKPQWLVRLRQKPHLAFPLLKNLHRSSPQHQV